MVDDEDDGADVTHLYTREDERQKGAPRNRMKGWAYVEDGNDLDGADETQLYSGEPVARRRREEERMRRNGDRRERERGNRSSRASVGGEGEDADENEDTVMGGTDDSNQPYPTGSMNNPPASSAAPLSAPPNLPGLPAPNQPNTLIPVPRDANGKGNRRLLNADQNMWWNQYGQDRTNPPSDNCHECVVAHRVCDLNDIGYPCTRCQQKGHNCRNGLPSQRWEQRQILAQTGVTVPTALQNQGRSMGRGNRGRPRTQRGSFAPGGRSSSGGRGISGTLAPGDGGVGSSSAGRDVNSLSPQSNKSDKSTLSSIVVATVPGPSNQGAAASSSRPARRARPKRSRSVSPERDDNNEEEDDRDEDDDDDDGEGSVGPSRAGDVKGKRPYKRRKETPLTDEQYTRENTV